VNRSYDVYTPTRAIAYHDYGPQKNGHGDFEWFKRSRDRFRKEALLRAKTVLQLRDGSASASAKANLGIYGLGKRRTLEQLVKFLGISTSPEAGNKGASCGKVAYVPYDHKISPTANLYDEPDNLDPQPEYALRTNLTYYEQVEHLVAASPLLALSFGDNSSIVEGASPFGDRNPESLRLVSEDSFETAGYGRLPSLSLLVLLWGFGLVVWCTMFASTIDGTDLKRKLRKKTKEANFKEV
jgi:Glycosyltransferase (GlcNAc)